MKLKKALALILALAMLPVGQIVFAAQNEAAGGARAGWFIEAETNATTVVSDENAIGGKAAEGEFTVAFTVPEEKSYYLYARVSGEGSISYAFGEDTAAEIDVSTDAGVYTWVKISDAKALAAGDNTVTVTASAGVKTDGIIVSELSTLPLDSTVTGAAYAQELALPDAYPDIFDESMINTDVAFEAGDRVLFLGDSITHSVGHTYQFHTWILTYYATRYPDSEFTYINAGRGGDRTTTALTRLVSDVKIHDYNKIVVMLGTNDVGQNTYNEQRDDAAACDALIESYIKNLDILLAEFSDKEIILMGPTGYNEFSVQSASSAALIEGYNSELRRVNNYLKDYAYENSIPYIDLNTSLTKAMLYYTDKDSSYAGLFGKNDRTHPSELGHYIMAYNFLKAQGAGSLIASTTIDASSADAQSENAEVSIVSATNTAVSYTYKPNSLPIPSDTYYRQLQQLIPIDDELNRELITVTGLDEGNYTIKMNGTAVLENVPSTDLAAGVNIADLSANPNQQRALAVKGVIDDRSVIERQQIRAFRATEYSAIATTANGLTSTMTYDELIAKASENTSLASYVAAKKALYNYYGAVDYLEKLIYTINKPEEVTVTIERTGDLDESTSTIHTYTTEKVSLNDGSPEIVFHAKDTVSTAADFVVTDGVLSAYNGTAANVYVPAGVTEIKAGAFTDAGIKYLHIPSSVTTIEAGAFKDLANAEVHFSLLRFNNADITYEITDGVAYSDNALLYYSPVDERTSYMVLHGTTSISDYAFANALNLDEVLIHDTVTEIGEGAFDNTSLTIKCYEGSAAHNYAVANNLTYELVAYSTNTNLTSLAFNGVNVFDFDPQKKEYNIRLFAATSDVNITAEAEEAYNGASVEIVNNGAAAPCAITVKVTAQDKTTVGEYVLNFTVEEPVSNFTNRSTYGTEIKHLRLDSKYSIFTGYDADESNQFILEPANTSNEFGYGLLIQRNKGDAYIPTYGMPFYSNNGDPFLGAADGRYWYTFDISEAATVYAAIEERTVWANGKANGWRVDTSGLELRGSSGTWLYKKHFAAGEVKVPSFGTHSSYEESPTSRIEYNPSAYAIIFDSTFATEEDKTAEFAVTYAAIGGASLSESEADAPEIALNTACGSVIFVEGRAPEGELVSMRVTPADDDSTLIAEAQATASALGIYSFESLPGEEILAGVTYKAEITNSTGEKYTYYFKTGEIKHTVSVTLNPEVSKYFMGNQVTASNYRYADTKLGDRETFTGSLRFHKTEEVDGVVTPVKESGAYVMELVTNPTTGVQFSSERTHHRTGVVGNAFKGLNHIVVNQNISPGLMKTALSSVTGFTWEGETITLDEMHAKYCEFFAGDNVLYSFVPDAAGTVYIALPYENDVYTKADGWSHIVTGEDDLPAGYAEWGVVPESTYFSTKYPYQLAKYGHNENRVEVLFYDHIYYRSFEAGETVNVYTGGANYTEHQSNLPKTIIRWGEHLSMDTDFELTYNDKTANISSDTELSAEGDSVTLSANSTKGAKVVLSQTNITTFPATVTATVTAAAGNTAVYEITIDSSGASTKTVNLSVTSISGDVTIEADDTTYDCSGSSTIELTQGTTARLTAEDNGRFMYWVEAGTGRIVSYDTPYTFAVGSDRGVNALYRDETAGGVYYVMFKNANNQIMAAGYTSSAVYVPENPYLAGYSFEGWYIGTDKMDISAGDDVSEYGFAEDTVISAGFTVSEARSNLYFENESTTTPYGSYRYNAEVTLSAPEAEAGKVFVYWMCGEQIVSYNEVYTFRMGLSDVYVKAVYADAAAEEAAVITMSDPVVLSGENRISFLAERDLPEGYTLIESGILLSTSAGITLDNATHKAISASTASNGQFTVRKANVNDGDTWYAKAYLIYEADGQVYTLYSREVSETYNE